MNTDPHAPEEFETWLAEVELANETIRKLNSGEMTIEEFDYREKRREAYLEREKQAELSKIKEKEEKLLFGRSGKGQTADYKSFCRYCFTEYEIILAKCNRCGKNTMTCEERIAELKGKIEVYKEEKARKIERKHKWDMWQKTKASLWKKTSTNYSKWEYFTSDEEEENDENKDPILPKNDPNFKALERDLDERSQRKKLDVKKADELKQKGNDFFKEMNYKKAVEKYTEALEIVKDYKALYTNRALAYIKLGKFNKAIEDCNRMLEIAEIFEKGYEKSRENCLKALLRRGFCWKEKGEIELAEKDLKEAEKLSPMNKEIEELKKSLFLAKKHKEKAKEIVGVNEEKKTKNKDKIEGFIKENNLKSEEIDEICKILAKNEEFKVYFFEKKGLEKAVKLIEENVNCFLLMNILLEENVFYQESFCKLKGMEILINKLEFHLKKAMENSKFFDSLEELIELLIMLSQTEKLRNSMKENEKCLKIYQDFFEEFLKKFNSESKCLSSFISFISNLCYGGGNSLIKTQILKEPGVFLERIKPIYENFKRNSRLLKENLGNFIVNLCSEEKIRGFFSGNEEFLKILLKNLKAFDIKKNNRFIGSLQSLLGVFSNLCFQASQKTLELFENMQLENNLQRFLEELNQDFEPYKEIFLRVLNIYSKIAYYQKSFSVVFVQKNFFSARFFDEKSLENGFSNHCLRILARVLSTNEILTVLKEKCKPEKELIQSLILIIKGENEQRFCNTCIVIGSLGEIFGGLIEFREIIERLIGVVRDRVGLMRKNAAILLAKLSKEEGNLEVVRGLHGIELLHNVSNIILGK